MGYCMNNFFPTNLKYLRNSFKMTQQQLADKLQKDLSLIGKWEKGIRIPLVADTMKISNIFNIELNDLLTKDLRFMPIEEISPDTFETIARDWVKTNNMTPEEKQRFLRELSRLIDEEN